MAKIIIIDDEPAMVEVIVTLCREKGHQVYPFNAPSKALEQMDQIQPQVVITFGADGAYGHPDHIAISQLTTAAIVRAADRWRVSKLYYIAWSAGTWMAYQSALKKLTSTVDGVERQASPAADWSITTRIDTRKVWPSVWRAVQCHRTQMSIYKNLADLPAEHHRSGPP